ncbi:MAG: pirin family protein, partial [Frankia sp.]
VRRGLVDHADSFGSTGRYGHGDVQWLTAGRGMRHAEMFPLVETDTENTLELFQIWLNLPSRDKTAHPHFTMIWAEEIPHLVFTDQDSRTAEITVIAGPPAGAQVPSPPPASWAARPEADVAIWHLRLDAHARLTLPPASNPHATRALYVFTANTLQIADVEVGNDIAVSLRPDEPVNLVAGSEPVHALMLQGAPIGERVVARGPFVMNTPEEIDRAYHDYRTTKFGGWPWPDPAPHHGTGSRRFAQYPDGHVERPVNDSPTAER